MDKQERFNIFLKHNPDYFEHKEYSRTPLQRILLKERKKIESELKRSIKHRNKINRISKIKQLLIEQVPLKDIANKVKRSKSCVVRIIKDNGFDDLMYAYNRKKIYWD
jgi:putative lipase involved disintegration of autophagic bodies